MKDKYYVFDVDGFFRDYKKNKRKLRDLKWEKAQVASNRGMDYSKPKVSGGLPSSTVEQSVERAMKYDSQIKELEQYFKRADEYMGTLNEEEKGMADMYFVQGRRNEYAICELSDRYHLSRASVYRAIKVIRNKIRQYEYTKK